MKRKTIILIPTEDEAVKVRRLMPDAPVRICGVGMVATAMSTVLAAVSKPDMMILAGISGSYGSYKPGESVLVGNESVADLGAFRGDIFKRIFRESYDCPYTERANSFPVATSNSVNAAGAPYVDRSRDIENMEGAAFFAACRSLKIPFLELRCVSNMVGDDRADWKIDLALDNLARDLKILTDEIDA